jgi:hypothetical protein
MSGGDVVCLHSETHYSTGLVVAPIMSSSCRGQQRDFRDLHLSTTKPRRRGSARSMSSWTTEWSTATSPASNTTNAHEVKKRKRRRFMMFTNVLMKFLERKDPTVFHEARAVIRDCAQKKKRGEVGFESVTESVKTPLKQVVGPSYWKKARGYLKTVVDPPNNKDEFEPLSPTEEVPSLSHYDLACLEQSLWDGRRPSLSSMPPPPPLTTKPCCSSLEDETKIRRERLWMLIRILMKYLEYKDPEMYLKAKEVIKECVQRNKKREKGYLSLSASIKASVKSVVGASYWRRAESYLQRFLIDRANEEAATDIYSDCDQVPMEADYHFVLEVSERESSSATPESEDVQARTRRHSNPTTSVDGTPERPKRKRRRLVGKYYDCSEQSLENRLPL